MTTTEKTQEINLWILKNGTGDVISRGPHENQKKILQDGSRFKVVVCGRRFGKTTLAVNSLIKDALMTQRGKFYYVAPTYRSAKEIAWQMLLEKVNALPKQLVHKINESDLYVVIGNNSRISIKGADNPDSLRGVGLDGCVLDEYADIKPSAYVDIIRPALLDRQGWCTFIGTPKGFNHFYDLYMEAKGREDWATFHFSSYDNPYIPKKEIDFDREQIPEDRFAQEYLAEFRKKEGLVYPEFVRDLHVVSVEPEANDVYDRLIGIDFGYTNPTAVLTLVSDGKGRFTVIEEWYETGKTTEEIGEYVRTLKGNRIYADPAEPDRIDQLKRIGMPIRDVSKDVTAGIDAVRDLLKQNKLFIHKRCKNLIRELETYSYPEVDDRAVLDRSAKEKPIKQNDHAVDALRYVLYMNYNSVGNFEQPDFNLYTDEFFGD